jgi:histone acetyltransferase (RNA polymerase elongator complex component)
MAVDDQSGEIVGVVKFFEKEDGVAWVSHLAIATAHQRQGIGKLLLAHIEELAKDAGYKKIGCLSRLNTTDYFGKAGYKISGLPTHYFGTTQVVWMEKPL